MWHIPISLIRIKNEKYYTLQLSNTNTDCEWEKCVIFRQTVHYYYVMTIIHRQNKKSHTNDSLFALITERICCGIVSTTLCNVTTFISIQSCINFWP